MFCISCFRRRSPDNRICWIILCNFVSIMLCFWDWLLNKCCEMEIMNRLKVCCPYCLCPSFLSPFFSFVLTFSFGKRTRGDWTSLAMNCVPNAFSERGKKVWFCFTGLWGCFTYLKLFKRMFSELVEWFKNWFPRIGVFSSYELANNGNLQSCVDSNEIRDWKLSSVLPTLN